MAWWNSLRRRKNNSKKEGKNPSPRFARRAFLVWGATAAGAGAVAVGGYKVADLYLQRRHRQEMEKRQNEPPILTSKKTRERYEKEGLPFSQAYSSLREAVENWPEIKEKEMIWFKQKGKPGQILRADEWRKGEQAKPLQPKENDYTSFHTHKKISLEGAPEKLKWRILSRVSIGDIRTLLEYYLSTKNARKNLFRTDHSLVLDAEGKVIGYCSVSIGKLSQPDLMDLYTEVRNFDVWMFDAISKRNWKRVEKLKDKIDELLAKYKNKGLRIHHTSLPGYVFKDGYFQKKT